MKKILSFLMIFTSVLLLVACSSKQSNTPANLSVSATGMITWSKVENAASYTLTIGVETVITADTVYSIKGMEQTVDIKVKANSDNKKFLDSNYSESVTYTYTPKVEPDPDPDPYIPNVDIKIGISGKSEVKSGHTQTYVANVTGHKVDDMVLWSIVSGSEFAAINPQGELTAGDVDGDKVVTIKATSVENTDCYTTKTITITAKPTLTSEMLNKLKVEKIGFDGYITIDLYNIGLNPKLQQTVQTDVKTSMDTNHWYAEYYDSASYTEQRLYFANHNDLACAVSVNFMNEEEYIPMVENNHNVSWIDAGLYNNFMNLEVSDFRLNEDTWRYDYVGNDALLVQRMVASANPYNFKALSFSLIIEEDEIVGIYAESDDDYTIVNGYKAIQHLIAAISVEDTVKVPTVNKFIHDDIHDILNNALANMHALNNYTLTYRNLMASVYFSGYTTEGFKEYITSEDCYFVPFTFTYLDNDTVSYKYDDQVYGYKKINENLYNSYYLNNTTYIATRAYNDSFDSAKPSLAFAGEIFNKYAYDEEKNEYTFYVSDIMMNVASTFYYGVGNDINLYGIFGNEGRLSSTQSFTPYVVVKDGYITNSGFYYNLGTMYGVVEIEYTDFNTTSLPEGVNVEFETRYVPTSWNELTIQVSSFSSTTEDDVETNAYEYLTEFLGTSLVDTLPFFGNVIGDTYGFGLTLSYIASDNQAHRAIGFYYDVPLDIDYSITSSMEKVENYLLELGFVKNNRNEYYKDGLWVAPVDSSLDFIIYIWKE